MIKSGATKLELLQIWSNKISKTFFIEIYRRICNCDIVLMWEINDRTIKSELLQIIIGIFENV